MSAIMKNMLSAVIFCCVAYMSQAQTKVFKEVSEEVSSSMQIILQDNALVGYLVFTRLEAVSPDSFSYRITIMDENLNDIGTVNFRDQSLRLHAVSFEQDILCLAYLKSNFIGQEYKNKKEYKEGKDRAKNAVVTQFLDLSGKILNTNATNVDIKIDESYYGYYGRGYLKNGIQLRNVPGKGFALFYGDERKNTLSMYDLAGKAVWTKHPSNDPKSNYVLTSREDIFILTKRENEKAEGGYEVIGFNAKDGSNYDKYVLKDKKGNQLKVLGFENDPVTGKPFISGTIISDKRNGVSVIRDVTKGAYVGVFTIDITGPKKADYKENYSYWNDGSTSGFSEYGKTYETGSYPLLQRSFRDYHGNTYFVGSTVIKRTRWGMITSGVLLSPFLIPPVLLAAAGTNKYKQTDATILKQNSKGKLQFETSIDANAGRFIVGRYPVYEVLPKSFYTVSNANTKSNYVIVDDVKDVVVYNISQKKVVRTIPHKDGSSRINIFPAKEGYIMVSEYNRKEKYTKLSIEAL